MLAEQNDHPDISLFLIDSGADVRICDRSGIDALHYASAKGHTEVVDLLIKHGASVRYDQPKYTPLHFAAYHNYKDIAELVIDAGADINAVDNMGRTPLHEAAENGYGKMDELLLEHGADATIKDYDGKTPLDLAQEKGAVGFVKLLGN
jgi:ankyrin repeat protein